MEISGRNFHTKFQPEISGRNFHQKDGPEISTKNLDQKFLMEIFDRNFHRNISPEISNGNFWQKFPPKISTRNFWQKFLAKSSNRNLHPIFRQEISGRNFGRLSTNTEKVKTNSNFSIIDFEFFEKHFRILSKIFVLKNVDFFKMSTKSRLLMFEPKKIVMMDANKLFFGCIKYQIDITIHIIGDTKKVRADP